MKKIVTVCLLALGFLAVPQQVGAQGFLDKINKGLSKVNKALDKVVGEESYAGKGSFTQANGVIVGNPIPGEAEIQLVGAYGTSKSTNYGDVTLVFKVKLLVPKSSISIGQGKAKSAAFDEDGNTYQFAHSSLVGTYDCTEGMYVKVKHEYPILDVRKSADKLQMIRVGLRTDWEHYGDLTLKNVPVEWDVAIPE